MKKNSGKYIRIGTTLYKIVRCPLMSGDFRVWNRETLRKDHFKDFLSQIEKFDGFCSVPDHLNYQRCIGTFLNQYEPIPRQPAEGDCPIILEFLEPIFGEQLEMGLDYLQLLYLKPLQWLPIILLLSKDRGTGKTTFLNFLKAVFSEKYDFQYQ
jgi:hypothetical protein